MNIQTEPDKKKQLEHVGTGTWISKPHHGLLLYEDTYHAHHNNVTWTWNGPVFPCNKGCHGMPILCCSTASGELQPLCILRSLQCPPTCRPCSAVRRRPRAKQRQAIQRRHGAPRRERPRPRCGRHGRHGVKQQPPSNKHGSGAHPLRPPVCKGQWSFQSLFHVAGGTAKWKRTKGSTGVHVPRTSGCHAALGRRSGPRRSVHCYCKTVYEAGSTICLLGC